LHRARMDVGMRIRVYLSCAGVVRIMLVLLSQGMD
jgi:hypothetical protein